MGTLAFLGIPNTTSIRYIPKYHAKYNTFLTVRIRTLGLTMHISTKGSA
jgi:hypothetical protein